MSYTDWEEMLFASDVAFLDAIAARMREGDYLDAMTGVEVLKVNMDKRQDRELMSCLVGLMLHILKRKTQPPEPKSWRVSIGNFRDAIEELRKEVPRFSQERILGDFWDKALQRAIRKAEREMDQPPAVTTLTWEEVFDTAYDER